jgi:hypothetical protein
MHIMFCHYFDYLHAACIEVSIYICNNEFSSLPVQAMKKRRPIPENVIKGTSIYFCRKIPKRGITKSQISIFTFPRFILYIYCNYINFYSFHSLHVCNIYLYYYLSSSYYSTYVGDYRYISGYRYVYQDLMRTLYDNQTSDNGSKNFLSKSVNLFSFGNRGGFGRR